MRVSSLRQAGVVFVFLDSNAQVLDASVNRTPINDEPTDQWGLRIDGFPQQGVELQIQIRTSEPLKLRLVDQSYGLPPPNAATNDPFRIAAAKPDVTLLAKSFSF
jgi:hypothetical protein